MQRLWVNQWERDHGNNPVRATKPCSESCEAFLFGNDANLFAIKDGTNTNTGTGDVVSTKMTEDKIKALQKRTQDKINNGDFKSQKEIDNYVKYEQQKVLNNVGKQVDTKVPENIKNAVDQSTQAKHNANENDANARGAKKVGRTLKHTQLGVPVKKDGKVLKWKTYEEKKKG